MVPLSVTGAPLSSRSRAGRSESYDDLVQLCQDRLKAFQLRDELTALQAKKKSLQPIVFVDEILNAAGFKVRQLQDEVLTCKTQNSQTMKGIIHLQGHAKNSTLHTLIIHWIFANTHHHFDMISRLWFSAKAAAVRRQLQEVHGATHALAQSLEWES